jgi:hypothetical protein
MHVEKIPEPRFEVAAVDATAAQNKARKRRAGRNKAHLRPANLRAMERRTLAYNLRVAGNSMAEIARMVKEQMEENGGCGIENYGPAHVRKDIEATIAWMQKQVTPSIEAYQQIELERIEKLVHTFWPEAVNGNRAAAQFIVTLHERLAKVLGTDAARKVSVEVDVRHTISRMAAEQGLSKSEEALAVEEALRIFAESKR